MSQKLYQWTSHGSNGLAKSSLSSRLSEVSETATLAAAAARAPSHCGCVPGAENLQFLCKLGLFLSCYLPPFFLLSVAFLLLNYAQVQTNYLYLLPLQSLRPFQGCTSSKKVKTNTSISTFVPNMWGQEDSVFESSSRDPGPVTQLPRACSFPGVWWSIPSVQALTWQFYPAFAYSQASITNAIIFVHL